MGELSESSIPRKFYFRFNDVSLSKDSDSVKLERSLFMLDLPVPPQPGFSWGPASTVANLAVFSEFWAKFLALDLKQYEALKKEDTPPVFAQPGTSSDSLEIAIEGNKVVDWPLTAAGVHILDEGLSQPIWKLRGFLIKKMKDLACEKIEKTETPGVFWASAFAQKDADFREYLVVKYAGLTRVFLFKEKHERDRWKDAWFSGGSSRVVGGGRTMSPQAFNNFFSKLPGLVKSFSKDERQREEDKFGLQVSIECVDLANFTFEDNSEAREAFASLLEMLKDAYSKAE